MESMNPVAITPGNGKLRRTFAKVLHIHKLSGVAPEDGVEKGQEKVKFYRELAKNGNQAQSFDSLEEEYEKRLALEALLAKLFATVSSLKSAYAQLQYAQSPYDSDGIQKADNLIVSELKTLSELKQCFSKKQFDPCPERTVVLAEIQELNSLLKTYEITGKKLESQLKLKNSEITFLKENLKEHIKQSKLLEKRLNQSLQLSSPPDNLHFSGLNPSHFATFHHHAIKSIRGFVRLMVEEMKLAAWDIHMAANSIQPGVFYYKTDHKCFAFEHFVCRVMFEAFNLPYFSGSSESSIKKKGKEDRQVFFQRFTELLSMKTNEYITGRPRSRFAKFCRAKYLQLIHPKMEHAFFGHTHLRNQVNAGEFPDTSFAVGFLEMARRVWLLHCLAFSFETEAKIFLVSKGCRFSQVYMRSVAEEEAFYSPESEPRVAFTVVPGFIMACKTVIQGEVYLSSS